MTLLRAPLPLRPGALMPSLQSISQSAAITPSIHPLAFATPSSRSAIAPTPCGSRGYSNLGSIERSDFYQAAEAEGVSPSQFKRNILRDKDVLLSGLPTTATPADIRALARESKTANDVARIEFIYTRALRPTGKALVSMSSHVRARAFEADAHGRIVGGRMVAANLRSTDDRKRFFLRTYGDWPASYQIPFDLIEYEAGKLVLLRNIPKDTFEARLEERLANRYDIKPQDRWRAKRSSYAGYLHDSKGYGGSHDAVLGGVLKLDKLHADATTTSFIVRCQTPSEAMRLVRRWHNTYFAPATFDIQDTGGRYRVSASILY
ncbi:biotin synthase [Pseudozyma hubeiensis SY62]|uniref:Biotin synthase n=1 Tax=Pseudozyma hubeiensis (strain SY62) TaxID=1305764 RepID=R9PCX9_PSEHS|nr:biotin synthase [Pseudozyma hubeiensis SY62]GAC95925.1 biotin synthase [Pseudozyma hubeiensis SY62]